MLKFNIVLMFILMFVLMFTTSNVYAQSDEVNSDAVNKQLYNALDVEDEVFHGRGRFCPYTPLRNALIGIARFPYWLVAGRCKNCHARTNPGVPQAPPQAAPQLPPPDLPQTRFSSFRKDTPQRPQPYHYWYLYPPRPPVVIPRLILPPLPPPPPPVPFRPFYRHRPYYYDYDYYYGRDFRFRLEIN